ncbi:hypothetical protein RND81_12G003400 [Saponaria officinalis]|uniref:Uncharacterized protein n=1 Tax=Saponaria officinalis TaxID=3572 RepID=A0AAW1H717_SAPOF
MSESGTSFTVAITQKMEQVILKRRGRRFSVFLKMRCVQCEADYAEELNLNLEKRPTAQPGVFLVERKCTGCPSNHVIRQLLIDGDPLGLSDENDTKHLSFTCNGVHVLEYSHMKPVIISAVEGGSDSDGPPQELRSNGIPVFWKSNPEKTIFKLPAISNPVDSFSSSLKAAYEAVHGGCPQVALSHPFCQSMWPGAKVELVVNGVPIDWEKLAWDEVGSKIEGICLCPSE